jgi:nitrite reductase/ring-hydroxylating ferredoxin subunit
MIPDQAAWLTVTTSAQLPEGAVCPFTAGAVIGFVSRADGQLHAVSGICTHQGCRLIIEAASPTSPTSPAPATAVAAPARPASLACPCHGATFALDGAVRNHRLPITLTALPALEVREADGAVQVYAPAAAPSLPARLRDDEGGSGARRHRRHRAPLTPNRLGSTRPIRRPAPAGNVAAAASALAAEVIRYTDFGQGVFLGTSDINRLTEDIAAFRDTALDYFRR